jgi:hypothetical protein
MLTQYERQLTLLARAHTHGAAQLADAIGIKSKKLNAIMNLRSPMPAEVKDGLAKELGFELCGFNDERFESWLVRRVEDLIKLEQHGFKVTPTIRLGRSRPKLILSLTSFSLLWFVFTNLCGRF